MSSEKGFAEAWREAGAVLGIDVTVPFVLDSGEGPLQCTALVHCFGSRAGTLVVPLRSGSDQLKVAAKENGFYLSLVNEDSYATFDWDLFVSTLDDWGWQGEESATPSWYTGKPWA